MLCVCCDDIVVVLCECVVIDRNFCEWENFARNHLNVGITYVEALRAPVCCLLLQHNCHVDIACSSVQSAIQPRRNHTKFIFYDFTFYVLSVLTGWQNVMTCFPRITFDDRRERLINMNINVWRKYSPRRFQANYAFCILVRWTAVTIFPQHNITKDEA